MKTYLSKKWGQVRPSASLISASKAKLADIFMPYFCDVVIVAILVDNNNNNKASSS